MRILYPMCSNIENVLNIRNLRDEDVEPISGYSNIHHFMKSEPIMFSS